MHVAVVGTVGLPSCYGGFESLVENLVSNRSPQINYEVFCSSKTYNSYPGTYNGAKLTYIPLKANGAQSIFYDIFSLILCLFKRPDVVLILGVSGCFFLPVFRVLSSSKVVTNIDGLEWKRAKWGGFTKKFLKLSESIAVRFSHLVITDNNAITNYVKSEYHVDSKTIAYGGDHAIISHFDSAIKEDYALALCRIEPENNIDMILDAFSQTEFVIKFIGNWDSSSYGKDLKMKYQNYDNLILLDPIYDLDILFEIRKKCFLYIHGHSAGGTNPSLVEMMHFGTDILAYDCDFNRFSTEDKAEYFSNSSVLVNLLKDYYSERIPENGSVMKLIAERRYTWKVINEMYEKCFK